MNSIDRELLALEAAKPFDQFEEVMEEIEYRETIEKIESKEY